MDSDYVQLVRYKLQKRLKRLNTTGFSSFHGVLMQSWGFLQENEITKGILDDLENRSTETEALADKTLSGEPQLGDSDYLEGGDSLETFLDQFPTVSRDQALAVISASRESLLSTPTSTQARLEFMRKAANDKLFLDDLNATLEDFRHADRLEHVA